MVQKNVFQLQSSHLEKNNALTVCPSLQMQYLGCNKHHHDIPSNIRFFLRTYVLDHDTQLRDDDWFLDFPIKITFCSCRSCLAMINSDDQWIYLLIFLWCWLQPVLFDPTPYADASAAQEDLLPWWGATWTCKTLRLFLLFYPLFNLW